MKTTTTRRTEILTSLNLFPKRERDLHRELCIDSSLCSKLLKDLERDGYIELRKVERKGFRHFKEVVITEVGKKYKEENIYKDKITPKQIFEEESEEEEDEENVFNIQEELKMESMGYGRF